jgi:hypothetical protein
MKRVVLVFTLLLHIGYAALCSSVDYLNCKVNIDVTDCPVESVLKKIELQAGFSFSYNAELFSDKPLATLNVKETRVSDVLNRLLANKYRYRTVGNHVVILKQKQLEPKLNKRYIVSGVVTDMYGIPLNSAIVYEVNGRGASLTKSDGKYAVKFNKRGREIALSVSCRGYNDTVLFVNLTNDINLDVELSRSVVDNSYLQSRSVSQISGLVTKGSSVANIRMAGLFVPKEVIYISDNLKVKEERFGQVSFLPSVGTNFLTGGVKDNKFSLNIIAGYSAGVRQLEIGSVANIVRNDVTGVQISGVTNIVGGNTRGVQISGFANKNSGNVKGLQVSGVANIVNKQVNGMQVAGFVNTVSLKKKMLNGAPKIYNSRSGQISGFANIDYYGREYIQIAGFYNRSHKITGAQISGFYNRANSVLGVQTAAFTNIATDDITGIQISGFYNYAKRLKGVQFGIVNYCDSITSGFPVGLINIVRRGYRTFEITTDESAYVAVNYKTGGRYLYSLIKVGISDFLQLGYGIGATTNHRKRFSVNAEVISSAVLGRELTNGIFAGNLYRFQIGLNYKIYKSLTFTTGPSFNLILPNKKNSLEDGSIGDDIYRGNKHIKDAISDSKDIVWIGWNVGFRF